MKSSADTFFKMLTEEVHNISYASSNNVHGIEVHEGDWVVAGSVKQWTFTIDGQKEILKEKIVVDKEIRTVTMVAVGGHVLDKYKAYKIACQVLPDGGSAKVKVEIVYEKLHENDADPDNYLRFIVDISKDDSLSIVSVCSEAQKYSNKTW